MKPELRPKIKQSTHIRLKLIFLNQNKKISGEAYLILTQHELEKLEPVEVAR
jgi:hypothetical protein